MNTEVVYSGRDNTIDLELRADGAPVDELTAVTRMVIYLHADGNVITLDSNASPGAFMWGASAIAKFALGGEGVAPGYYFARLVVYDPDNINGIEWGNGFYMEFRE